MTRSRSYSPASDALSCDILIAGGGIVGLWVARLAQEAGLKAVLLDRDRIGSGASGGLLGALMPHMPERWNPKKQFQLDALISLETRIAEIETETGLSCGYRRCGRLLPLAKPHHAGLAAERHAEAELRWGGVPSGYAWRLHPKFNVDNWPGADAMPHGVVLETLSARVNPRLYMTAMKAGLGERVTFLETEALDGFDDATGMATTSVGRTIRTGHAVLSAGHASFDVLGEIVRRPARTFGSAIKGQAALLETDIDPDWPLVFQDGTYVVPHDNGLVAVGSTSERQFDAPFDTDEKLDAVISRAVALCPLLAGAPVLERWANLRPKAVKRDPMIGFAPGHRHLIVATGGFKITFGIAHEMARCAVDLALGGSGAAIPESFRVEHHLN
ncbi:MAG: FAD-binding oxidoreductase [Alphaproteobacteria bacterium]|nr:FAD-binding oxidoreductase [Alphaproteobacteria bacterium]